VEDHEAGARPKSYVEIHTGREKGNPHPAPMALDLALHLVKLSGGSTIIDPFAGSGTTAIATRKLGRSSVLIERNEAYCKLAADRLSQLSLLAEASA
jgi:DNA modification methylase